MSLRNQQQNALAKIRAFLRSILSEPRRSQKVMREMAYSCLRHFPFLDDEGGPMFSRDPFECGKIDAAALDEWAKGDWCKPVSDNRQGANDSA